jgi:hypothetical protein
MDDGLWPGSPTPATAEAETTEANEENQGQELNAN